MEKQLIKEAMLEVLEEQGLVDPYISRKEIVKMVGRRRYDKAVENGLLKREKSEGETSKVRIKRSDFAVLINQGKI